MSTYYEFTLGKEVAGLKVKRRNYARVDDEYIMWGGVGRDAAGLVMPESMIYDVKELNDE